MNNQPSNAKATTTEAAFSARDLLDQVVAQPSDHLCRRLRADDGARWFSELLDRVDRECDTSLDAPATLKDLGRERLAHARLTEEIEEATAIYFAGLTLLLASPDTRRLDDATSISPLIIEEVLLTMQESLAAPWPSLVESALRWID